MQAIDSIMAGGRNGDRPRDGSATRRSHRAARSAPETAIHRARLPTVKTLGESDFTFQPSIKRDKFEILDTLQYPERKDSVVLLGAPPTVHNSCRCKCLMLLVVDSRKGMRASRPSQRSMLSQAVGAQLKVVASVTRPTRWFRCNIARVNRVTSNDIPRRASTARRRPQNITREQKMPSSGAG